MAVVEFACSHCFSLCAHDLQALVSTIKLFNSFLPDVPIGAPTSASTSVASPLFHLLSDLPAVKELCAVIYLPADVLLASSSQPGQPSTLQHITANRQFGGSTLPTAGGPQQQQLQQQQQQPALLQASRLEIVEETANERTTVVVAAASTSSQLQSAPQDVKGLPVFDRL